MNTPDDGGPAFPTQTCDEASLSNGGTYTMDNGMSLRDYFAAQAMLLAGVHGLMAVVHGEAPGFNAESMTRRAYQIADAMLAERQRSDPGLKEG